jgi:hypothetical protein
MRIVLLMMFVTGTVACGEPTPPAQAEAPAPAPAAVTRSPCSLLAAEEVAAVIGPLAGPAYRAYGTTPNPAGDRCRFDATDLRSVVITVEWQGGAQTIAMMNTVSGIVAEGGLAQLKLIDGTTLAGEWDEARVTGCCEFAALRGDQMVTVNVAGTGASIADAASLANGAIVRLDQPLLVDDGVAVAAALDREGGRPQPRSVCKLVPRSEADALGAAGLLAEPTGDGTSCTYQVPLDRDGSSLDVTLNVQWRDGFRELQMAQSVVGNAAAAIGLSADAPPGESGPWDAYASSVIGVMAVKRDVLVSVESGPFGQDLATKFIAKAIENL